jgi:hypothetical protein
MIDRELMVKIWSACDPFGVKVSDAKYDYINRSYTITIRKELACGKCYAGGVMGYEHARNEACECCGSMVEATTPDSTVAEVLISALEAESRRILDAIAHDAEQ